MWISFGRIQKSEIQMLDPCSCNFWRRKFNLLWHYQKVLSGDFQGCCVSSCLYDIPWRQWNYTIQHSQNWSELYLWEELFRQLRKSGSESYLRPICRLNPCAWSSFPLFKKLNENMKGRDVLLKKIVISLTSTLFQFLFILILSENRAYA